MDAKGAKESGGAGFADVAVLALLGAKMDGAEFEDAGVVPAVQEAKRALQSIDILHFEIITNYFPVARFCPSTRIWRAAAASDQPAISVFLPSRLL